MKDIDQYVANCKTLYPEVDEVGRCADATFTIDFEDFVQSVFSNFRRLTFFLSCGGGGGSGNSGSGALGLNCQFNEIEGSNTQTQLVTSGNSIQVSCDQDRLFWWRKLVL